MSDKIKDPYTNTPFGAQGGKLVGEPLGRGAIMANTFAIDKLMAAHVTVLAAVERVKKRGRNKFHNYDYATEADLVAELRPALAANGLALFPSQTAVTDTDMSGNVRVTVEYTYAHVSGQIWPWPLIAYGVGNDRSSKGVDGDKAVYKALTGANKYLLFKLFQVDTGDEPEAETTSKEDLPTQKEAKSAVLTQVEAFAAQVAKLLNDGATPAEIYKFEQANKSRFDRMRKEFGEVPSVKVVCERVDSIYEKMG